MVYVNRFTDPLPHYCGPEEGEEGGRRESGEKWGGGVKLEEGETRKILRAPLQKKRGGERQGVGDTSLQCVSF